MGKSIGQIIDDDPSTGSGSIVFFNIKAHQLNKCVELVGDTPYATGSERNLASFLLEKAD